MKTLIAYESDINHQVLKSEIKRDEFYILIHPTKSIYEIRLPMLKNPICTTTQLINAKRILFLMKKWDGDMDWTSEET